LALAAAVRWWGPFGPRIGGNFPYPTSTLDLFNKPSHQRIFSVKMVAPPPLHADIYPAVDPKNFVGSQKGNVVVVIG